MTQFPQIPQVRLVDPNGQMTAQWQSWFTQLNRALNALGGVPPTPTSTPVLAAAYKGNWSATETYYPGDEASFNNNVYRALQESLAVTPVNGTYWLLLGALTQSLINTSSWVVGSGGSQGNYLDNMQSGGTVSEIRLGAGGNGGVPFGPYGGPDPIWIAYNDPSSSGSDGGWINSGDLKNIDATKSLRMSVWVQAYVAGMNGDVYLGCDPLNTNNLNGTSNANPYFITEPCSSLVVGRWYLMVGYLHGSGYPTTGPASGLSGIWDPTTGALLAAGTDFTIKANATQQMHRAFLYYSTTPAGTAYICFARPRVDLVNGFEPTIQSMLANTIDGISDGTTYQRMPIANMDVNRRALIDFTQAGHLSKNVDNIADGSTYLRMPTPPPASAAAVTSITQSGSSTTINVAAATHYLGGVTVNTSAGSVNPGAYGNYYIYADNPGWGGGAVTFQASTSILAPSQAPNRLYFGSIITTSGGGGSGGGTGGCFSGDTKILTTVGWRRFDSLPPRFEVINRSGRFEAHLLVHPMSSEPMRKMGPHLVTEKHNFRVGDKWVPAKDLFHERASEALRTVYNAEVYAERFDDKHYLLENGLTAHNPKP